MEYINVKLRIRGNASKYRKMISTQDSVYGNVTSMIESSFEYYPDATIQNGEWFKITNASQKEYAIDLFKEDYQPVNFDSLKKSDFGKIDFLFVISGDVVFFQNISKSKLVRKKRIYEIGEEYRYYCDANELVINDYPDAIYCKFSDTLYFRKLEAITSIFKGISELYREATDEETEEFLHSEFIVLENGYTTSNVKKSNRKRIALAVKTLAKLEDEEKKNIFTYIGEYCQELKNGDNSFTIGSEDDMKLLLFGIEQRFYTTPIGGEQRLANSSILINKGGKL